MFDLALAYSPDKDKKGRPFWESPVERGGRPRGLSPMAMFSIAVVDRGFKRLPLCSATILPFLDFLAQPLDFGRGHRA
jgi:hypothetical protein